MWQGNKVGEINNNEPRDLPMSTNNGGDSISLQAELERVYTEYREAVLKKDVETVIKLMPGKLGDDKTLAERSREEAIKALENFGVTSGPPELLPALTDTKFLKIVERDGNFYYAKAHVKELDNGYMPVGVNRFSEINGEWTISLTYLSIVAASSADSINDAKIDEIVEKAIINEI